MNVVMSDIEAPRLDEAVAEVAAHGTGVIGHVADVAAGETATLVFEADVPGVFEVEFEDSFTFITELEVR